MVYIIWSLFSFFPFFSLKSSSALVAFRVKANPIICCRFCLCWNVTCANLFCSDHGDFGSWRLASVLGRPKGYQNRSVFQKPPQKMPTSDTTEWKETCWKLLHGREMSLLPWPHNCFCDGEQRPSLSLHAWEGCVSLSSRIACCPHQYFSQAMVHSRSVPPLLLNKTEWKIQGLWDMGVSHVKPLKFSTRTGWLCSNPSCLLVHPWA